ncbi:type IV toxin-antitoxin system AbiEi family antitoxin [Agromyces bauzanensis]
MARLPVVLGTVDLPIAELCAARLDGELFAIDDGWAPVDEPDLPAFRAAVLALRMPRPLVIERMSAAWVHGALPVPPAVAQFCVPHNARIAVLGDRRASVREVKIDDSEIVDLGGIRCTSVVRTGFDVLRDPDYDTVGGEAVVTALIEARPWLPSALRARLDAATRMPHKSLALARLAGAEAAHPTGELRQPSLTR